MRKTTSKSIYKWTTLLLLLFTLGLLVYGIFLQNDSAAPKDDSESDFTRINTTEGTLSNQTFSQLIEDHLSEFNFVEHIEFTGKDEGYFRISGTLSDPDRLLALNAELQSLKVLLDALKGERITIEGHLGKDDDGNGCFVTDTITFSNYTIPAGVGTEYIEKYTSLNQLLEVPFEEIEFTDSGVSFQDRLPSVIQTALYK